MEIWCWRPMLISLLLLSIAWFLLVLGVSGLGFVPRGASSVWSPASQESSHVGHGGVGVISLRGAPLSLPASVTAQFSRFFDCGRALCCLLPVASGRFLHLVVLHGYQGADGDAERLSLTDQLLDAALGELRVVALDQPCLIVGGFNVEPTKIPCLSEGISAGALG